MPGQNVAIYFANGIATDIESASTSLRLLRRSLDKSLDGKDVRYRLAYNQTGGMAADLLQAAQQAGIQWDSEVFGWLLGRTEAPDWLVRWFTDFLGRNMTDIAPELATHVNRYDRDLRSGTSVLVVAHSQGNFYVNQARQLLAAQLTPVQMRSFGVFAVATPANNVAGAAAPYLTNQRDIISFVPGALPANWTLQRADGTSAEDTPQIRAHLFADTYLSDNYNIKPTLLQRIHAQVAALPAPAPACAGYRQAFAALVAGSYQGSCNSSENPQAASIAPGGLFSIPSGSFNVADEHVTFTLYRRLLNEPGFAADNRGVAVGGRSTLAGGGVAVSSWRFDDQFDKMIIDLGVCEKTPEMPDSFLPRTVDIAAKASELMADSRSSFAPTECTTRAADGAVTSLPRQAVFVGGTTVEIGDFAINLAADRVDEKVGVNSVDLGGTREPNFSFLSERANGGFVFLTYNVYRGITEFSSPLTGGGQLQCIQR